MSDTIPTIETILLKTKKYFGVPPEIVTNSEYRTDMVVQARRAACYLARKLTFMSTNQIGKALKIDAATVSHHDAKATRQAKADPEYMKLMAGVIDDIEKDAQ